MASTVSTDCLRQRLLVASYDHDPDTTAATVVTPDAGTTLKYVDMKDYSNFMAVAMSSTLTGNGITKLEIVADTDTTFASNLTVIKDSGTVAADAVGDYVVEECTAAELAQLSSDGGLSPGLRYVAARLTVQNSADEAVVTYVAIPKYPRDGLTANAIS